MTYLQNYNYELLATAYANYILTFHSFLYECLEIIEVLIADCLISKKYFKLQKIYNLFNELIFQFNKNIIQELDDSYESQFQNLTEKEKKLFNKKRKLWVEDINKQIKRTTDKQQRVHIEVQKNLQKKGFKSFIIKIIIQLSDRRHRKITKKILEKSVVFNAIFK